MIMDVTGLMLCPGNGGKDCLGNGSHLDSQGKAIECCCDECDYLLCCAGFIQCDGCLDKNCPNYKN